MAKNKNLRHYRIDISIHAPNRLLLGDYNYGEKEDKLYNSIFLKQKSPLFHSLTPHSPPHNLENETN